MRILRGTETTLIKSAERCQELMTDPYSYSLFLDPYSLFLDQARHCFGLNSTTSRRISMSHNLRSLSNFQSALTIVVGGSAGGSEMCRRISPAVGGRNSFGGAFRHAECTEEGPSW